jgi:hypothetical protein
MKREVVCQDHVKNPSPDGDIFYVQPTLQTGDRARHGCGSLAARTRFELTFLDKTKLTPSVCPTTCSTPHVAHRLRHVNQLLETNNLPLKQLNNNGKTLSDKQPLTAA